MGRRRAWNKSEDLLNKLVNNAFGNKGNWVLPLVCIIHNFVMKKNLLWLLFVVVIGFVSCDSDDDKNLVTPDAGKTVLEPFGYSENVIPDDFANDLWVNTHNQDMTAGETFQINPRRVPEIIDNAISNNVVLPTFTYEIVRGSSVEVDENGLATAKELGVSIVEVSYNAIEAYEEQYGACSHVNKTYVVFNVMEHEANFEFKPSFQSGTYTYDTYYFKGDQYSLDFSIESESDLTYEIKCNDVEAIVSDDVYTVNLTNRANVIEITAINGEGEEAEKYTKYYVLDARKIEIKVENLTHPDEAIKAGDQVQISFNGITLPVYKLATIYNPTFKSMWGGNFTTVRYQNSQLGEVMSNVGLTQWELHAHNAIKLTFDEAGSYKFTDGHVDEEWWGSVLGSDKVFAGQGQPNLNAPILHSNFSFFPDFTIEVAE